MSKQLKQFSPGVRERAVQVVREHRNEYPSLWATIESIAPKIVACRRPSMNIKRDRLLACREEEAMQTSDSSAQGITWLLSRVEAGDAGAREGLARAVIARLQQIATHELAALNAAACMA